MNIQSSPMFQGLINLLNDLSTSLLWIAPILAAVMLGYYALRKMMADQHEAPQYDKKMKTVGICLAIVFGASALVSMLTFYFNGGSGSGGGANPGGGGGGSPTINNGTVITALRLPDIRR